MPTLMGLDVAPGACLDFSEVALSMKVRVNASAVADSVHRRLALCLTATASNTCVVQILGGLATLTLLATPWIIFTCWYCSRLSKDTVRYCCATTPPVK